MSQIGTIEIQMMADLARLRADMNEAKSVVGKAASDIGGLLSKLGVGLSAGAFMGWIKGAIDAADSLNDLSKSTGVAVEKLSGLKLAAAQSGSDLTGIANSISKLSVNIGKDAEKFAKLGVSAKDPIEAFKQLADVFVSIKDPQLRAAFGAEALGKSWRDAAPLLAEGGARIGEMIERGENLAGVTQDMADEADKFNDQLEELKLVTSGLATSMAGSLLPTLNAIAKAFGSIGTESGAAKKETGFFTSTLQVALEAVSVLALNVKYVFSTVGGELMTWGKQIKAFASGDFAEAVRIGQEWTQKAALMRTEVDKQSEAILSARTQMKGYTAASSESEGQTAKTTKAVRDFIGANKDSEAASKSRAAEDKKLAKEIEEAEEARYRFLKKRAEAEAAVDLERIRRQEAVQTAEDNRVQGAAEMVAAIKLETEQLGMSNTEREISIALLKLETSGIEKGTYAYTVYAEEIRKAIVDRNAVKASIEQTKSIADGWKKMSDDIGQGLTDSLFRAFESGKGFFSTLWDGIKNLFKTTVLRLAISPVQAAIGSVLGGFSGGASAASGLGAIGGFAGDVFGSMIGAGTSGAYGGAAATLGSVMPYLAAAGAIVGLVKSLDKSGTMHKGSVVGVGAGGASTLYGDGSQILNNLDSGTDTALRALGIASTGGLNALSGAFGGGGGYGSTLKFASDGTDASIGGFGFSKNGAQMGGSFGLEGGQYNFYASDREQAFSAYTADVAKATRAAIDAIDLPSWAREQFAALGESASIEELTATIGKVIEAKDALVEVGQAAEEISPAALEAAAAVAKMAENFSAAMAQLSSDSAALEVQLLRAGGDESGARSLAREQFLASQDVTEEQRASIAALYDYNQGLRDQITELERATAVGNERAGLERQLLELNGDTNALRALERDALDESNRALYDQINALKDLQSAAAASAIETAKAAQAQAEAARVAEAAAQRLAASAAKANAPITQAGISASAAAMDWTSQSSSAAAIERIKAGKYGANYAAEFARMTGYGSVGVSPAFTAGQERAFVNGALIADARAQARANPVNRKATGGGGADGQSLSVQKIEEADKVAREQLDGTKDLIDSLNDLRRGLSDFRNDLMGSALDPANPAAKYATEKALAESLGRQALTGDPASIEAFQRQASTFLEMSQGYNASTPAYAADFARMVELLDGIEKRLEKQTTTATATLKVQQAGLGEIAESSRATAKATTTSSRTARVTEQRAVE